MEDVLISRRTWAALAATLLLALPFAAPAQAKWPERPVKIVLPFGAGGVADTTARIVAEKLSAKLGERFVIENMPGPGGISAAKAVTSAAPDGYTLGLVTNGTAISVAAFKNLPFDPVKDFEMISTIGTFDLVFVVNAESEFKTMADFIKAAKVQPGKLNIGTIAVGGTQNLGAELLKSLADINIQIIAYKSSPEIVVALLRNDVQMLVEFPPAVKGQVNDGKLRVLAASGPARMTTMPDVPTAAQAGVTGYEVTSWNAIGAPKGTPKEVLDTMNKALHEVLAAPDVKAAFAKVDVEAKASTPAEMMKRLQDDIKKWDAVIQKAGIEKK